MRILSIGNSFAHDGTRYLEKIAYADKKNIMSVVLHIGGCTLERHYMNMVADADDYDLMFNGEFTGFKMSLRQALRTYRNGEWDVVTFQQASHESPYYEKYQPYLNELSAYVKKFAPSAKQVIHQTWAYEQGCEKLTDMLGYRDQADMFKDVKKAYAKAAKDIDAKIIPSGELFQKMLKNGFEKVHRDTFHASLGAGRYALAALWYETVMGGDIMNNTFCDFEEEISKEEIAIIKKCVREAAEEYGWK